MIYKMALRNLLRQKRRSILTALGMIFGMVIVSFSISLTDGSYSVIIDKFTKNQSGHIQIHSEGYLDNPSLYKSIKNPSEISKILSKEKEIKAFTTRVFVGGLGFFNKKSTGLLIHGIDPQKENEVTKVNSKLMNQVKFYSKDERSVILTKHLSDVLNITKGDQLVIISQGADGSIANDMYTVIGFVDSKKNALNPNLVYMPIKTLQEFLSMGNRVHEFAILLNNIKKSAKISTKLSSSFDQSMKVEVASWQVVLKDFYRAMELDKKGNNITLMVLILVVAIGILNTVLMSVLERTREFGVLKAIGTTPLNIFKLIIIENTILSFISLFIGILISLAVVYYFSIHEIKLTKSLHYGGLEFSGMKATLSFSGIMIPAMVVYSSTLLVSLWPAFRAASIIPIKAMSDH